MKFIARIVFAWMIACALLYVAPAANAQEYAQAVQPAAQNAAATSAQHRYDPLAGRPHLRSGMWGHALEEINPHNEDYGASVARARCAVISATIKNAVFWLAVVMSALLLLALCFLNWLIHERARRLDISVTILTEIANAFLDARHHALDAIERHNRLADDYNTMAEKMAALEQQKAENLKRVRGVPEETPPGNASSRVGSSSAPTSARVEAPAETARAAAESDVQARQRYASQISALQEKNKTLRNSLNEALAQLDESKRRPGQGAGA